MLCAYFLDLLSAYDISQLCSYSWDYSKCFRTISFKLGHLICASDWPICLKENCIHLNKITNQVIRVISPELTLQVDSRYPHCLIIAGTHSHRRRQYCLRGPRMFSSHSKEYSYFCVFYYLGYIIATVGLAFSTCITARAWRTCRDACRER